MAAAVACPARTLCLSGFAESSPALPARFFTTLAKLNTGQAARLNPSIAIDGT
jgi:hypothetical protein